MQDDTESLEHRGLSKPQWNELRRWRRISGKHSVFDHRARLPARGLPKRKCSNATWRWRMNAWRDLDAIAGQQLSRKLIPEAACPVDRLRSHRPERRSTERDARSQTN